MDDMNALLQHIIDELQDVQMYMKIYHNSHHGIFKDIACDEMSHACAMKNLYIEHGGSSDPFINEWENAEKALNS